MARFDALSRYSIDASGQSASRTVDPPLTRRYVTYTIKQGDTLENIAARHLGNARRYWEIADINPQIKFPTDLPFGTIIRLPT